jgi:MiaB/RimO family radical SAM methylthiotransferase
MREPPKTAYLTSNGCPENLLDSSGIKKYLEENGWQIQDSPDSAHLILFNACALTQENEAFSLSTIRDFKAKSNNGSQLIVWGCLPKINPHSLSEIAGVLVLGEKEIYSKINEISQIETPKICPAFSNEIIKPTRKQPVGFCSIVQKFARNCFYKKYLANENRMNLYRQDDSSIFYIKTSSGCLSNCAYCAVRISRGTIQSRPVESILKEFRKGLEQGYKEFSLMGTDLGGQGLDLGYNLCDLLNILLKEPGEYKIGIRNMNPQFMKQIINGFGPILKTGKVWFIGLPAESGSNRILKLMRRRYSIEEYLEYVQRLKSAFPKIIIRNQMLVGFPSENEKDFQASLKLIDNSNIDFHEIYTFSPRPGTAAADMVEKVPQSIKHFRSHRMVLKVLFNDLFDNRSQKRSKVRQLSTNCPDAQYS